jgi:hypothetical protein
MKIPAARVKDYIEVSLTRTLVGGTYSYNWHALPVPKMDSGDFELITNVDGGRNANGDFIGQTVGSDKLKINLSYPPLTAQQLHDILIMSDRDQGGQYTVWVRWYDPRYMTKRVFHMYWGDRGGSPFRVSNPTIGEPDFYQNVTINFIEV